MQWKKFVDYAFDSYNVVVTPDEAKRFRELFFAKYPGLVNWHKNMAIECEVRGGVSNRFGRFRKLPDIYSNNFGEKNGAIRCAINTPVQSTASDLLIASATQINRMYRKKYDLKIVGTVHDSILFDAPEDNAEWLMERIREVMAHPDILDVFEVTFKVPIEADVGIGAWGSK